MLLLHQALPHMHHEHGIIAVETTIDHHHGEHNHGHDHSDENEDGNENSGLLGFLLGSHAHTYHSIDFEVKNIAKHQIKVKEVSDFTILVYHTFLFKDKREPKKTTAYQPPGNFCFYLSTSYLRGPPVLG